MATSPYFGALDAAPSEALLVKALRTHATELVEVRMLMSSPSRAKDKRLNLDKDHEHKHRRQNIRYQVFLDHQHHRHSYRIHQQSKNKPKEIPPSKKKTSTKQCPTTEIPQTPRTHQPSIPLRSPDPTPRYLSKTMTETERASKLSKTRWSSTSNSIKNNSKERTERR